MNLSIIYAKVNKSRIVTFGEDITILSRFDLNMEAMKIMCKNPLTGIGFGNVFAIIEGGIINDQSGLTGIPMIGNATTTNFLADIAAETGIIGLTSFTIFLISLFKRGVKTIKNIRDEKMLIVFIGAFASCIGLFVTGLTSYPILLMPFFWISAGILTLRPYMWKTLPKK